MTRAEKLVAIAENEKMVFEAGKQAEYDAFWEALQKTNGRRDNYLYSFAGFSWTDKNYNPKYDIKPTVNAASMFNYSSVTDTKVTIDLTGLPNNVSNMFAYSKMVTIRKIIFGEKNPNMTNAFTSCSALENVTAEGVLASNIDLHWSTKLTRNSIESLIGVLSDTVSGKTATFSTAAVNKAFESSEGANDGSSSAEWTALVNTKTNWTVSLV